MGTVAEKLQKLATTKEAIRQAIISKGQSVAASDTFASYPDKIAAIQTGTDTSDATVTAADLRSGKIAYGKDGKVTGSVADVEIATPSIIVSSSGLITASSTQSGGFVAAGSKSATQQMSTKAAQTYTPGTANQTIASGRYLTGTQTILGDSNLVSSNIKKGVSIFGKAGAYEGAGAVMEPLVTTRFSMSITSSKVVIYIDTLQKIQKLLSFSILTKGSILISGPMVDSDDETYLYLYYMCSTDGWRASADYDTAVDVGSNFIEITLKPGSTKISSFINGLMEGTIVYIPA